MVLSQDCLAVLTISYPGQSRRVGQVCCLVKSLLESTVISDFSRAGSERPQLLCALWEYC